MTQLKADEGGVAKAIRPCERAGFSRVDLLGAIAGVAVIGSLAVSGSSTAKSTARAVQCLENGDQLIRAWAQYAQCNGGWLPPNTDDARYGNWLGGDMFTPGDYGPGFNDPTNYGEMNNTFTLASYKGTFSAIGSYFNDYKICHCPADDSTGLFGGLRGPAAAVPRVRSYSMSQAVGTSDMRREPVDGPWLTGNYGQNTAARGPYLTFGMISSFSIPGPSSVFVIVHEDPYSVNDATFAMRMVSPDYWVDFPASVHNRSTMVNFADGHCIIKHWVDPRSIVQNGQLVSLQINNPDIEWFRSVTSARLDGTPLKITNPSP
jgi:hypothetical protein